MKLINNEINEQLAMLKEKGRIYEKWTKRLHKLEEEEKQWRAKVEHCTVALQKEQKDVDRLESKSAYDTACRMLQDVQEQRIQVEQELQRQSQYKFWESDYQVLWEKKEQRFA